LGHPDWDTYCGYLATRYEEGAREAGHEVKRVNLGEMHFDPILHKGYKVIQPLEPDLISLQNDFRWANHIVLLYPNWWGTMPALLKGLFDRFYIPGFAFKMKKGIIPGWYRLLKGRTGRVIITMQNRPIFEWLFFGDYSNEIRRAIFWFAGIWPTRMTMVGNIETKSPEQRSKIGDKIAKMGKRGV
jgi:putative NADPH-quinone reductase